MNAFITLRNLNLVLAVIAVSGILCSTPLLEIPFSGSWGRLEGLAFGVSATPIYQVTSGLVYSDSFTTGDLHYWDMNGSAVALGAPYSYGENASGLNLSLLAPSAGKWAGFYGVSPLTPAHLFHAKISLGQARPTSGLLDTAVYVQQQMVQDPRIDAMGCGADIYPNLTHWTISLQAGDQYHEIVPQTIYTDNSPNQPSSRECTLVTDGNTTLSAYIDGQKVFSSNKMNLNMPEPLQYYVELQTNSATPSAGTNFTGAFSDYYATSSDLVTVLNAPQGSIVKIMSASSGQVLATTIADSTNQAKLNVGMYHMPINATVQVFDGSGQSLVATTTTSGMYGGDVYNVGSPSVHQPSIHIVSYDKSNNRNFVGVYTNISSVSGSFVDYTPFSYTATPFQPYIVSITDDNLHTFMNWEDGIHTIVRVLTPTTADQNLTAYYSNDQVPAAPSSLTSLTPYTTNVNTPSITGDGIAGFSVQLFDNSNQVGSPVIVASNGTWVITTPVLSDGAHVFTATEKNLTDSSRFSTSASSSPITMTIDTAPPSISMTGSYTPFDNASMSGTAFDTIVGVKAVDMRIDNGTQYFPPTQTIVGDWSNWSFESAKLLPGNHTLTARVTNLAGGQAFASLSLNIPQPDPSITVSSIDTLGSTVTGMWTVLSQNGAAVQTGFTPINFKTTPGQDYSVTAGDYSSNYFDHWHDAVSGQDVGTRTITILSISNPVKLTAVYRHTALPPGSGISVNGMDLSGVSVNGMYASLTDASNNNTVQTGFTPVNYATTSGDTYMATAADYGTNYFDHWHNAATGQDTTTRNLSLVASNNLTQLTVVYRHTATGSGSSISVIGTDMGGAAINGMYTTLTDANTNTAQAGFTPANYATTSGDTYVASASDYGTNYFDHWHNAATGQDTITRSLALVASGTATQLTVVYRHTAAGSGSSIVVSGSDLNGTSINGMYTTLTNTSDNTTRTGFTTTSYSTTAGITYIVTASDYGTNHFDHWHNTDNGIDTATRSLAINATSSAIQLIAVYRTAP